MRSVRAISSIVALVLLGSGAAACDKVPAKGTLNGWPPGEPTVAGTCEFRLERAVVYHSSEWHLEVEVEADNVGPKSAYCAFAAQLVTAQNTALTRVAKNGGETKPEDGWLKEASSRETNETGMSTGAAEGAWVYVELSEGHWPMDTSVGVYVTPERVRPPG